MLLDEVDVTGYEALPAALVASATPAAAAAAASARSVQSSASMANGTLPGAAQRSSANLSANSHLQAPRKRGRPKGSTDKAPRMTKARKLAMQQGNDGQM